MPRKRKIETIDFDSREISQVPEAKKFKPFNPIFKQEECDTLRYKIDDIADVECSFNFNEIYSNSSSAIDFDNISFSFNSNVSEDFNNLFKNYTDKCTSTSDCLNFNKLDTDLFDICFIDTNPVFDILHGDVTIPNSAGKAQQNVRKIISKFEKKEAHDAYFNDSGNEFRKCGIDVTTRKSIELLLNSKGAVKSKIQMFNKNK